MPPREVALRIRTKLEDRAGLWFRGVRETRFPTFATRRPAYLERGLATRLDAFPHEMLAQEDCRWLAERCLEHRFDLLGSGWTRVAYGTECAGTLGKRFPPGPMRDPDPAGDWLRNVVNAPNFPEAARLWRGVSRGYSPIDWQLDFKSGYRYGADSWARRGFPEAPGSDIKVPWELSRMQHLPILAVAFRHAADGAPGFRPPSEYLAEFQDQILDFLSANPPGFGVNWACTMDVGIRIANWLVARDLMIAAGARPNAAFETALARGALEHGRFIVRNLEWSPGLRGNHYLADIVGLLFVAAYLPAAPETDGWLLFATHEFLAEFGLQFGGDGANFEASTCYHRLSLEMSVYAAALLAGLPKERLRALHEPSPDARKGLPRFFRPAPIASHPSPGGGPTPLPPWAWERLARAADFIVALARPDGRMPQFGDNDSGRFLKIHVPRSGPVPQGADWAPNAMREDHLDLRHVVAAVRGLIGYPAWDACAALFPAETAAVASMAGRAPSPHNATGRPSKPAGALRHTAFPDFGLQVWSGERIHLVFRCGPIGQRDNGGHAHNDQLSFDLCVGGRPLIHDIGTGVYTPDWDRRNRFRSTAAHNTLCVPGMEQDPWENTRPGLFSLISRSHARLLAVGDDFVEGEHYGFGVPHRRTLRIRPGRLEGLDECAIAGPRDAHFHLGPGISARTEGDGAILRVKDTALARIGASSGDWEILNEEWSPGYGMLAPGFGLRLRMMGSGPIKWYIEWL